MAPGIAEALLATAVGAAAAYCSPAAAASRYAPPGGAAGSHLRAIRRRPAAGRRFGPARIGRPLAALGRSPDVAERVVRRLQQAKGYPQDARSRGDQGVALVTFTIDRNGRVLSAALARSSRSATLDEEAVAMIHRADPLPAMPAEMQGSSATLTVPANFTLR